MRDPLDPQARADARAFAAEAHGDQRYGQAPYVTHLDDVVALLDAYGHGEAALSGYLHDVIEDTEITFEDVAAAFCEAVAHAVAFCTDAPGPNRKARKAATYARMAEDIAAGAPAVEMGIVTKVADRLANVTASAQRRPDLLKKYRGEQTALRGALYVPGLCDAMWDRLEALLSPDE